MASKPTSVVLRVQSGTERTMYCTWAWSKTHVDHYEVSWKYSTGDGVWFIGNTNNVSAKQDTYTAPDNATSVSVAIKPVSTKHKVNKKNVSYWTATWSTRKERSITTINITEPQPPDVRITSALNLIADTDGWNGVETYALFRIKQLKGGEWKNLKDTSVKISRERASLVYKIAAGYAYRVYVRGRRGKKYGAWSQGSDIVRPIPAAPTFVKGKSYALSATSFRVEWTPSAVATHYEVEYATHYSYFTKSPSDVSSVEISEGCVAIINGRDTGQKWYYRVRACNASGESAWLGGGSTDYVLLGAKPDAPTTWSETSAVLVGNSVNLHFVHNTQDGSDMTSYQVKITAGGTTTTQTVTASGTSGYYTFDTSGLSDQDTITWQVCTAGVTGEYSPWSVARTVTVYEAPTLSMILTDAAGESFDALTTFPLVVEASPSPVTQTPLGYELRIVTQAGYDTTDDLGNAVTVPAGSAVFQKYYSASGEDLQTEISAGDVHLENNVDYEITCTAAMSSGLTATESQTFSVAWEDDIFEPNAQIAVDMETLAASINPYCVNENEELVSGVTLSVYRREYDGTYTEIATGVENSDSVFVTDPHPALDFARYRIVARSETSGAVVYSDLAGVPVGVKDVVIQWEEAWQAFDTTEEDALEEENWSGSMLRLPYNIDVSDGRKKDTSLIRYAGREDPVSYYGDAIQTENTWKVDVAKSDTDTLYALRRLARYAGDVYVREPSGMGYWASVEVSMQQQHLSLIVPVTMSVTKVEGGA